MERKELGFEDGIVQYSINGGKAVIAINPTDSAFVDRLYSAFEAMDKQQERYKAKIEKTANHREVFDIAKEMDAEMRQLIDEVFGGVSESIFGRMSTYSVANGLPVWCNFMLAVMDEIDTTFAREQKATNPRIQKYTAKYRR